MFENVVVGIRDHGQAGRDAIALARELASRPDDLTLVYVYVVMHKPAADSGAVGDAAKRRYALERLGALRDELGIDAQVSCAQAESVRRGLHDFASDRHADLLVVSASRRDELARVLVGDDAADVLENSPCAVAVAPAGYSERAERAMSRIGVAYDGFAPSDRALAVARELAAEHEARLSAFEAVQAPLYVHDPWSPDGETQERVAEARQRIAALGGVEPDARSGDAVEELTRYEQAVDLLVIGAHRYRPIGRFSELNTAQRLADHPSAPLLVLAHDEPDRARVIPGA